VQQRIRLRICTIYEGTYNSNIRLFYPLLQGFWDRRPLP